MSLSLAMVVSLAAGQICNVPTGIARFEEPVCAAAADYEGRIIFNDTQDCLGFARAGGWRCLQETGRPAQTATSAEGLQVLGGPPGSPAPGRTYFDSTKGCQQTWTGSAWSPATCPLTSAPSQPQPPNTLLSPAASTPTGPAPAGAAYYNTTCKRLLTYDGAAWETCPSSAATVMAQNSNAPSLPPGQAAANRGNVYFDTTLGCTRSTRDGLTWGDCLTTERCQDFTVSGLSIPLAGVTATATLPFDKAQVGASCEVLYPNFMPLNASGVCRALAGQIQYRFQSNTGLLSSVIAIPNGTYRACVQVLW